MNESRALPENYRPALSADVPEGRACGNCIFYEDDVVQGDRAWCKRWQEFVRGDYYCNAWTPDDDDDMDDSLERNAMTKVETRQIQVQDLEVREVGDASRFSGYAAVFNSDSEPLPFKIGRAHV
jgi:hypothetical protein